jgi:hypothetical protein
MKAISGHRLWGILDPAQRTPKRSKNTSVGLVGETKGDVMKYITSV